MESEPDPICIAEQNKKHEGWNSTLLNLSTILTGNFQLQNVLAEKTESKPQLSLLLPWTYKPDLDKQVQWGSKYPTSLVFKWAFEYRMT